VSFSLSAYLIAEGMFSSSGRPSIPPDADTTASSRRVFFFVPPRRGVRERQGPGTDSPGVGGDGGIPAIQEHLLQPGSRLSARPGHGREAVREEVV